MGRTSPYEVGTRIGSYTYLGSRPMPTENVNEFDPGRGRSQRVMPNQSFAPRIGLRRNSPSPPESIYPATEDSSAANFADTSTNPETQSDTSSKPLYSPYLKDPTREVNRFNIRYFKKSKPLSYYNKQQAMYESPDFRDPGNPYLAALEKRNYDQFPAREYEQVAALAGSSGEQAESKGKMRISISSDSESVNEQNEKPDDGDQNNESDGLHDGSSDDDTNNSGQKSRSNIDSPDQSMSISSDDGVDGKVDEEVDGDADEEDNDEVDDESDDEVGDEVDDESDDEFGDEVDDDHENEHVDDGQRSRESTGSVIEPVRPRFEYKPFQWPPKLEGKRKASDRYAVSATNIIDDAIDANGFVDIERLQATPVRKYLTRRPPGSTGVSKTRGKSTGGVEEAGTAREDRPVRRSTR